MRAAQSVLKIIEPWARVSGEAVELEKPEKLRSQIMDRLVMKAVFGNEQEKASAQYLIWELAQLSGARPASIHDFYLARGKGRADANFTTPAVNVRGMAYDTARAIFKKARELKVGAFILEIARSEMDYTGQTPKEFASVMLAAAIREGYQGPVFLQGDHFQAKVSEKPGEPKEGEIEGLKKLIERAIKAGFYNIDIDTSTLVDLSRENEAKQQESNIRYSLELFEWVRQREPGGLTISIGGEIGHIGGKNSTVADFRAYMEGFSNRKAPEMIGLSKISVQTGTSHGGVVLPDGSLAKVEVDFRVLEEISKVAREEYGMAGAVQHGASTLPEAMFAEFPRTGTAEVHLATGFQNLVLDHSQFPEELRKQIYTWLDREKTEERKEGWTTEQFHYKLRKKGLGQFKREIWGIEAEKRAAIRETIEERIHFLFTVLGATDSQKTIQQWVQTKPVRKTLADFYYKD